MGELIDLTKILNVGDEVYCILHGEKSKVEYIHDLENYPIGVNGERYTKYGQFLLGSLNAECVIFPSKVQRNWVKLIKEEPMSTEKTIIGYKLIKTEYEGAAAEICGYNKKLDPLISGLGHFLKDSIDYYSILKAGVLDLWFEPVYKNQYPDITINGYRGEFFDYYVKFGYAEISKESFIELYRISKMFNKQDCLIHDNSNRILESVTIGKGTFSKEQIKEIAEYYLNK